MREYVYTVVLEPDLEDGGYTAYVPALPGCHTQGETKEEALKHAEEAVSLYLATLIEEGKPVPPDTKPELIFETVRVAAA